MSYAARHSDACETTRTTPDGLRRRVIVTLYPRSHAAGRIMLMRGFARQGWPLAVKVASIRCTGQEQIQISRSYYARACRRLSRSDYACRREAVMHKMFQVVVVLVFISSVSCSRSLQQSPSPSPSPSPSAGDYINAGLNAIQSDPNGTATALANCMLPTLPDDAFGLHLHTMCCLLRHSHGNTVNVLVHSQLCSPSPQLLPRWNGIDRY